MQFDEAAARLLRRAYAKRGEWVGTYVANPSVQWQAWALAHGWGRLLGPDDAPGGEARTRWCRAMVRSCHNLNRKFMTSHGLDLADEPRAWGQRPPYVMLYKVGTVRINPGGVVVGRAFRIMLTSQAGARAAAAKIPDAKRWNIDGEAGPRYANWTYQE